MVPILHIMKQYFLHLCIRIQLFYFFVYVHRIFGVSKSLICLYSLYVFRLVYAVEDTGQHRPILIVWSPTANGWNDCNQVRLQSSIDTILHKVNKDVLLFYHRTCGCAVQTIIGIIGTTEYAAFHKKGEDCVHSSIR